MREKGGWTAVVYAWRELRDSRENIDQYWLMLREKVEELDRSMVLHGA